MSQQQPTTDLDLVPESIQHPCQCSAMSSVDSVRAQRDRIERNLVNARLPTTQDHQRGLENLQNTFVPIRRVEGSTESQQNMDVSRNGDNAANPPANTHVHVNTSPRTPRNQSSITPRRGHNVPCSPRNLDVSRNLAFEAARRVHEASSASSEPQNCLSSSPSPLMDSSQGALTTQTITTTTVKDMEKQLDEPKSSSQKHPTATKDKIKNIQQILSPYQHNHEPNSPDRNIHAQFHVADSHGTPHVHKHSEGSMVHKHAENFRSPANLDGNETLMAFQQHQRQHTHHHHANPKVNNVNHHHANPAISTNHHSHPPSSIPSHHHGSMQPNPNLGTHHHVGSAAFSEPASHHHANSGPLSGTSSNSSLINHQHGTSPTVHRHVGSNLSASSLISHHHGSSSGSLAGPMSTNHHHASSGISLESSSSAGGNTRAHSRLDHVHEHHHHGQGIHTHPSLQHGNPIPETRQRAPSSLDHHSHHHGHVHTHSHSHNQSSNEMKNPSLIGVNAIQVSSPAKSKCQCHAAQQDAIKRSSEDECDENETASRTHQPPALPPRPPPRPTRHYETSVSSQRGSRVVTSRTMDGHPVLQIVRCRLATDTEGSTVYPFSVAPHTHLPPRHLGHGHFPHLPRHPHPCGHTGDNGCCKKYVVLCCLCGGLSATVGSLFLAVHAILSTHTASLALFETVPSYIPGTMLILMGFFTMLLARRKHRYGILMKVCGSVGVVCALVCVLVTVTTTVVHMSRLQGLRECVYTARARSCTCYGAPQSRGDPGVLFEGTPHCEAVHGALYACLRALFGVSVAGILACIFSCMLVYQLLSHEKKKMYWEQLELRCRSLYGQGGAVGPATGSCGCCNDCGGASPWWAQTPGNLYTPNPDLAPARRWRLPWSRSRGPAPSPDSNYGFHAPSRPAESNVEAAGPYSVLNSQNAGPYSVLNAQNGPYTPNNASYSVLETPVPLWGPPPPYSDPNSPARRPQVPEPRPRMTKRLENYEGSNDDHRPRATKRSSGNYENAEEISNSTDPEGGNEGTIKGRRARKPLKGVENGAFQQETAPVPKQSESELYFGDVSSCCGPESSFYDLAVDKEGADDAEGIDYLAARLGKRQLSKRSRLPLPLPADGADPVASDSYANSDEPRNTRGPFLAPDAQYEVIQQGRYAYYPPQVEENDPEGSVASGYFREEQFSHPEDNDRAREYREEEAPPCCLSDSTTLDSGWQSGDQPQSDDSVRPVNV